MIMENNNNKNERIDEDILQCKEDILRASDVIPPFTEEKKNNNSTKQPSKPKKDILSQHKQEETSDTGAQTKETHEIPKFDLAQQIMAEQRKIVSVKRQSPQKNKMEEVVAPAGEKTRSRKIRSNSLISNIVKRDIDRFYSNY